MNKILITSIIFIFLVGSCGIANGAKSTTPLAVTQFQISTSTPIHLPNSVLTEPVGSQCLPPLTTFAFPYGETNIIPTNQHSVLPTKDWKLVSNLPNYIQPESSSLELTYLRKSSEEIWILTTNKKGIYRYNISSGTWTDDNIDKNMPYTPASFLFKDKKGGLWAARRWSEINLPLLSRYNDDKNIFESVVDKNNTFEDNNLLAVSDLKVDSNGVFWVLTSNRDLNAFNTYELYEFNPDTLKATLRLASSDYAETLEISSENKILLINTKDNALISYSPDSHDVKEYQLYGESLSQTLTTLYRDNQNRIWVNGEGWFDFSYPSSPQWFSVIRSPLFINYTKEVQRWSWGRPYFVNESSDGYMWFTGSGTGWLDFNEGRWCIFTSYTSNVVKDGNGNLWILVNNAIYKRSPKLLGN